MIYQLEDDPDYNNNLRKQIMLSRLYVLVDDWFERMKQCKDLSHNPPTHLFIPPGEYVIHTCSSCGKETKMQGSTVIW